MIRNCTYFSLTSTKPCGVPSTTSNIMVDKAWLLPDGAHKYSIQCLMWFLLSFFPLRHWAIYVKKPKYPTYLWSAIQKRIEVPRIKVRTNCQHTWGHHVKLEKECPTKSQMRKKQIAILRHWVLRTVLLCGISRLTVNISCFEGHKASIIPTQPCCHRE